jgi:TPR repeat protein
MYFTGKGAKKDSAVAEDWLQKAVAQGNAKAKKMLDEMRATIKQ